MPTQTFFNLAAKDDPGTRDSRIHFGVAGWSYPDWEGYVYGPGVKDKLRFVAGYVDMIEINSTFYRPPSARNAEAWVRRTADVQGFFFSAKLHQDVTHRGRLDRGLVSAFRQGIAPLSRAGKLKHLLAQFKYDFEDSEAAREHLRRIKQNFGDVANLTLELRHRSWQSPAALEYLQALGVTVANLDYPLARDAFSLRRCSVGEHAYFRLHGRNRKAWFDRKSGRDETYNYCYSREELSDIMDRAADLATMNRSLTLVANNHYQGKEVVNALQLKAMSSGGSVPVPDRLSEHYPELKAIRRS